MNSHELVNQGNHYRAQDQYDKALECYATAFVIDPENIHAWNNYGNVLREVGEPKRARPFLQHAIALDPNFVTAHFNLAIADLLAGNYKDGFDGYEWRWHYEHLAGTLPVLPKPQWDGSLLKDKTILLTSEQGFGDTIQFIRFVQPLHRQGARIKLHTLTGLVPLFAGSFVFDQVTDNIDDVGDYDVWLPLMSLPRLLKTTLSNLPHELFYIEALSDNQRKWADLLGPKTKMRIGVCWSGRKDNWTNRYKGVPVDYITDLAKSFPEHEWINLQVETTELEQNALDTTNIRQLPGTIQHWADTAGLVHHLDLVISVDTSVAHLAGAMGRTTWIPLTKFAVDWRWQVNTDLSPWYPSARLFRQPEFGNWTSVFEAIKKYLSFFKI